MSDPDLKSVLKTMFNACGTITEARLFAGFPSPGAASAARASLDLQAARARGTPGGARDGRGEAGIPR